MPILDINSPNFVSVLPAPYTLSQCHSFLKQAFTNAGFSVVAGELLGSTNITAYDFNFNPNAVRGRVWFVLETSISGSTVTVRCRLHTHANYNISTFTPVSSTGANNTTGASFTLSNTLPLTVYSIPVNQEIKGINVLENNGYKGFLGLAYFTNREAWYDENQWCWAMLVHPTVPNSFWLPYPNPTALTGTAAIISRARIDTFSTRNPNNIPYIVTAPFLTLHSFGIAGQFPVDIGVANSNSLVVGDILAVTATEEYWLAWPGDNGLVFRSV